MTVFRAERLLRQAMRSVPIAVNTNLHKFISELMNMQTFVQL
jgi:hypothetical protein